MTARPVMVLRDVGKRFGSVVAVDGVTWTPAPGRVTALVGLNGAGKSTLMRLATGLARPTSGIVRRDDTRRVTGRRGWSALIEAPALIDGISVRRNLATHACLVGASRSEVTGAVDAVGIGSVLHRRAGTLSQGYRQRVALAVALLAEPAVLLLDEPTNALDPRSILDLRRLVRRLADAGAAVVVSSHLLRELEGVADDLLVMSAGRVVYDGGFAEFVGPGTIRVRPADPADLGVLADALRVPRRSSSFLTIACEGTDVVLLLGEIGRAAHAAGIPLAELAHVRPSLEERFHAVLAEHAS